jgi:thiol:disulfide interchange protein
MHRWVFAALLMGSTVVNANPVQADHVLATLESSVTQAAPGGSFQLALKLEHDPHWHTYWLNPGDTGLPTKVRVRAPAGVEVGALEFPPPQRIDVGGLINFGYEGELRLLLPVTVAASFSASSIPIEIDASWLVCKEECIPGKATLKLDIAVGAAAVESPLSGAIGDARNRVPVEAISAPIEVDGTSYHVDLKPNAAVELFPLTTQLVNNAAPSIDLSSARTRASFRQSDEFDVLPERARFLAVPTAARAYWVDVTLEPAAASAPSATAAPIATSQGGSADVTLLTALGAALLGGLILNLMPCVFPVLSLKALSFATLGGAERRTAIIDGIAYTAGVVLSFVALAALLLGLRAAGEAVGWGFQLQNPWVNGALAYLFFAMGLSLLGAVSFGQSIMGLGQSLSEGHGARAAFFTGVLACVVASPCTAPFMGAALGYAVTQPAPIALGVFAVLGFGLALPMLLIALIPGLSERLPKPGAWMDRFKQALGFPLLLTAVWLLWVVGRQLSVDAVALLLGGMVALTLALMLKDAAPQSTLARTARAFGIALSVALAAGAWWAVGTSPASSADTRAETGTESFSAARLSALRAAGQPVLINMTADWCLTCKVNERIALNSDAFRAALERHGVVYMKGDWTHYDAEITAYLAQFGRNGVPLYVLYPRHGEPELLPQVLTPDGVAEALARAAAPTS